MDEEELARIYEWRRNHPLSSRLSDVLNSSQAMNAWIALLMLDMVVLLFYSETKEHAAWAAVLGNVVSALFAFDLIARLLLHGSSTGTYNTFWRDCMNILDAILVAIDMLTVIITVLFSIPALRSVGAIKSARSVRLVRLARVSRSVRVLRMGRIMAFCGKNFDWFIYQLDNKLQTPAWKAVGMFFLIMVFIAFAAVIFFLMKPVATQEDVDLSELTEQELDRISIGYGEALWEMWSFMADPGGHADICDRYGRANCTTLRFYAGAIAVFGICYFAAVLGFVVDGIRDFLDELKRGTRAIIERDHIVILGFSIKSVALISEICDALESEGGGTIVIMDDLDKQWMEDHITPYLPAKAMRGSRVVARRGSPMVQPDLVKVSASHARALIVMAQTDVKADVSDAQAVRVILALKGLSPPIRGHVVVELMDIDNRSIVELIGEPMVETVVSHDIVGRLMLLAVRNPGVNGVYDEVFGFQNDEFYIKEWPELEGLSFETITLMMPDAVVLGFRRANRRRPGDKGVYPNEAEDNDPDWVHTKEGRFHKYGIDINPPRESVLEPGDGVLVLAADDDSYHPSEEPFILGAQPSVRLPTRHHKADRTLVCGWRRDIDDMIVSLDAEVKQGSELHILCELPVEEREERLSKGSMTELKNLTLHHHIGNSAVRRVLEELNLASFHYVLILADEEREDRPLDSDAHNLATLLLLRDLRHRQGLANSRQLLELAKAKMLGHKIKQPKTASPGAGAATPGHSNNRRSSSIVKMGDAVGDAVGSIRESLASGGNGMVSMLTSGGRRRSRNMSSDTDEGEDPAAVLAAAAAVVEAAGGGASAHGATADLQKAKGALAVPGLMSPVSWGSGSHGGVSLPGLDRPSDPPTSPPLLPGPAPMLGSMDLKPAGGGGADGSATGVSPKDAAKFRRANERRAERKQMKDAKAAAAAAVAHADMCMIAVEILDSRTKSTLQSEPSIRAAADYLLSHTTMSKVLAMVLMQREVKGVLEELLSEEGQSFFVHQTTRFTAVDEYCSYWDVAARALRCNEVLVGYRPTASGTTIINPLNKHEPRVWGEYDLVVVCCDTTTMMTPAALNYKRLKRYWRNSFVVAGKDGKLKKASDMSEAEVAAARLSGVDDQNEWGGPEFITAGANVFENKTPVDGGSGGDLRDSLDASVASTASDIGDSGDSGSPASPAAATLQALNGRDESPSGASRAQSVSPAPIRESPTKPPAPKMLSMSGKRTSMSDFSDQVLNLVMNDTAGRIKGNVANMESFDDYGEYDSEEEESGGGSFGGRGVGVSGDGSASAEAGRRQSSCALGAEITAESFSSSSAETKAN
jgi:hypothetical protein